MSYLSEFLPMSRLRAVRREEYRLGVIQHLEPLTLRKAVILAKSEFKWRLNTPNMVTHCLIDVFEWH